MDIRGSNDLAFQVIFRHLQDYFPTEVFDRLRSQFPKHWDIETWVHSIDEALFETAKKMTLNKQCDEENNQNLKSLFGCIHLFSPASPKSTSYFYSPKALTVKSGFPNTTQETYHSDHLNFIFDDFIASVKKIPPAHFENLSLWLDHFETSLQIHFSLIACPYSNELSFYDYLKISSAFYVCLALSERKEDNILLIQGDFFGIQDFIFANGSETNKQAAKLLRGRSFQVSLFTELAALKILQGCELSSFNQIMNAAGKFLIVAPNTNKIREKIDRIQNELNQWFIQNTYGLAGLGIALQSASEHQFIDSEQFGQLIDQLFSQLEEVKLKRFNLTQENVSVQNIRYEYGACRVNRNFPALTLYDEKNKESGLSAISLDQINIGKFLAEKDRLIVCDFDTRIYQDYRTRALTLNIFNYSVVFTNDVDATGDFSRLSKLQKIHRFWDFSLPEIHSESLWKGYAKRYINAYVPYFSQSGLADENQYKNIDQDNKEYKQGSIKTFDYLACEDRIANANYQYQGQVALMTLKGDIDNLGMIFQKGLEKPNLAKMAMLSRQINQFFSLWLPAFCAEKYPNTYTVFAGGDDFFLIGPWSSTQKLATEMQRYFKNYVAHNDDIHFSLGMVMTKVGLPVPQLSALAENALDKAKSSGKNAVTIYEQVIHWDHWDTLMSLEEEIARLAEEYNISTSYLYSLIFLAKQAENQDEIENNLWRSRFYYRTTRYVIDKLRNEQKANALNQITVSFGSMGIEMHKAKFTVPLFNYLYHQR